MPSSTTTPFTSQLRQIAPCLFLSIEANFTCSASWSSAFGRCWQVIGYEDIELFLHHKIAQTMDRVYILCAWYLDFFQLGIYDCRSVFDFDVSRARSQNSWTAWPPAWTMFGSTSLPETAWQLQWVVSIYQFIQTLFGSSLDSSIRLGIINDNPAWLVAQLNSELLREICRISNISPKTWKEEQIQTSSNSSHHWAATMTLSGVAEQVSRAKKDMSTWYLRIWHAFEWYNIIYYSYNVMRMSPASFLSMPHNRVWLFAFAERNSRAERTQTVLTWYWR